MFASSVAKLGLTVAAPRTIARQAPLAMGFSRQEYWSGLSFPSPGDILIEPRSPTLQAHAFPTELCRKLLSLPIVYPRPGSVSVKVTQSCPTLCDPMDYTVHGIFQAKILEWIAIPLSRGSSQPRDWTQVSCTAGRFFTIWATRDM